MAMTRVKYGIEYSSRREEPDGSSGLGWIVVAVLVIAAVSFIVHSVRRLVALEPSDGSVWTEQVEQSDASSVGWHPVGNSRVDVHALVSNGFRGRSPQIQNLLLRLDKAAKEGDVAMQISTIEQLRELRRDLIADIDDQLIALLGELNFRWLYELRNPQWVTEVTFKRGDTAVRIARECGATFGSLKRLNSSVDVDRLQVGARLKVMNHPSFKFIVHKRLRSVDLYLNGKLFKRYLQPDTAPEISLQPGNVPDNLRDSFRHHGLGLSAEDIAEIDQLVPHDAPLCVSSS